MADLGAKRRDWHGRRGLRCMSCVRQGPWGQRINSMLLCTGIPVLSHSESTSLCVHTFGVGASGRDRVLPSCEGTRRPVWGAVALAFHKGKPLGRGLSTVIGREADPATRNFVCLSGHPGAL